MFGLMKHPPRLPYCGTCKTLGVRYGQQARVLLNHDTVFLADLLLEYDRVPDWSGAYRSFNCLAMPDAGDVVPALDFAAAATVVLTHFRIEDHQVDSGKRIWSVASRLLSPSYRLAAARLRGWKFPMDELTRVLSTQQQRERRAHSLTDVAEPTAKATGLFFSHGARVAGRDDLSEMMYRVGHRFGFLIYTLDAYEDRARDEQRGDFNPLLVLPGVDARASILEAAADLERELPERLALGLRANVEERLGMRPRVLATRCRKGIRERWRDAEVFARSVKKGEGAVAFAGACVLAFLFPHHIRSADSVRHGLGLGMNLMALGAILNSAIPPPPPPGSFHPQVAVPPGTGRTGIGCCNCCGCCKDCSCECCTDCCCESCAEGCCSACDCG
jgi:Family of unknown function (DUF5685)